MDVKGNLLRTVCELKREEVDGGRLKVKGVKEDNTASTD
jgi:hypothetical protein